MFYYLRNLYYQFNQKVENIETHTHFLFKTMDYETVTPAKLQYLQEKGLDLNFKNKKGQTIVMLIAGAGNKPAVQYLLDNNIDILCVDNNGKSPRAYANEHNHYKVIDILNTARLERIKKVKASRLNAHPQNTGTIRDSRQRD